MTRSTASEAPRDSFARLRALADTFKLAAGTAPVAAPVQRQALRLAADLAGTAVPLLCRKLRADDDGESSWAYFLLQRTGGARATAALRELLADATLPDRKKAVVLALLAELGADLPADVSLADADALRERSVRELVDGLTEAGEVARAAELLLGRVPTSELPAFLAELVDVGGGAVAPLLDELLLRDLPAGVLEGLRDVRAGLRAPAQLVPPARRRRAVYVGRRVDGARAVLVAQRARPTDHGHRMRVLVVELGADGSLGSMAYEDTASAATGLRRRRLALAGRGYVLAPAPLAEAAPLVAEAARRARLAHAPLPRAYWLGRDLCGLYDEHATVPATGRPRRLNRPRARIGCAAATAHVVARGVELLKRGDPEAARRAIAPHVAAHPDDAEARTVLGSALLELVAPGDDRLADEALRHFAAAARAEPDDPLRHWNLASAAKRLGRPGACYLALLEYRRLGDRALDEGALGRERSARQFVRTFERLATEEHPGTSPERIARGEELFERACRNLADGRAADAIAGFEAVLALVPSHYASWGNLGAALLYVGRREEAERCLRKALEFRPDYELAHRNLGTLRD